MAFRADGGGGSRDPRTKPYNKANSGTQQGRNQPQNQPRNKANTGYAQTAARAGQAGARTAGTSRATSAMASPYQQTAGGGGGYPPTGGTMGAMGAFGAGAPPMNDADFLNSDDVYLAALSRYNKSYDDLLADITRREGDYNVTYENSLDDLGYIDPTEPGGAAGWDFQNQQTAAGRGYQSLIQDFAARGLLHSGDFLGAQNDFTGQLGKQYDAMALAKQQFGEGLNQERTSGRTGRDSGIGQARAEALARMAQMYGAV